jgi:hypothetical protein
LQQRQVQTCNCGTFEFWASHAAKTNIGPGILYLRGKFPAMRIKRRSQAIEVNGIIGDQRDQGDRRPSYQSSKPLSMRLVVSVPHS